MDHVNSSEANVHDSARAPRNVRNRAPKSIESIVEETTEDFLGLIDAAQNRNPAGLRDGLLHLINSAIQEENLSRRRTASPKLQHLTVLNDWTVVRVILATHRIVRVDLTEGAADDMAPLAMYVDSGVLEGVYERDDDRIRGHIRALKPSASARVIESIMLALRQSAPKLPRTNDPNLVPVRNGIFDHRQQTLVPFSSEWIFLSKMTIDYDPDAENPIIDTPDGDQWDVESWMQTLTDDEGVPELLWEVMSAALRAHHRWNKSVWLQSPVGNNGKGTWLQLLRNVVGEHACASVKFADFGRDFVTAPLVHARVNLVDENGVGKFADSIEDWKAFTTGDVFTVNRKFKDPVAFRWRGFEVQCFNSTTPRTKDRSGSFYRRLLIVPFTKSFSAHERAYIKDDYIGREDVLKYVLRRALQMKHTQLSSPPACREALDEYRGNNNALLSFWEEFEPQLVWDLVPFRFLHDLYRAWFRETHPSGQAESATALISFLREHLAGSADWEHKGSVAVRPKAQMDEPELLIAQYGLQNWMNTSYTGTDPVKRSAPKLAVNYKGIIRRVPSARGSAAQRLDEAA